MAVGKNFLYQQQVLDNALLDDLDSGGSQAIAWGPGHCELYLGFCYVWAPAPRNLQRQKTGGAAFFRQSRTSMLSQIGPFPVDQWFT